MHKNENQNIEFKEQWRDDILKTVCAFANTGGGVIYIGLDDKGRSVVLKDTKKLLEDIPNKIRDILGIVCDVKIIKKSGNPAIKIVTKKYTAPISYKGIFYIRSGSTTSELRGMELTRFLLSRSGASWDSVIEPRSGIKDINVKTVRHFQKLAETRFPFIAKEKDIKTVLQKLNLTKDSKLKRAAILLFGINSKSYFTSAFIQIGRFISESEVISTDVIEGNLFGQVEKTIEILRLKYLENRFFYEGIYRKEDLVYPEEALREAVINAVIHRDYIGPHTQLRVYDNKLWLWNIGKLSEEITINDLNKPHSSYPRNELLADVFFKAGFIESWGRGTLKIINKCKEKLLPTPIFSESGGGFNVEFRKGEISSKTSKKEPAISTSKTTLKTTLKLPENYPETTRKIIELIEDKPYITRQEIADNVKITLDGVKYHLNKLYKNKIIKRVGPAKGGHWKVKS